MKYKTHEEIVMKQEELLGGNVRMPICILIEASKQMSFYGHDVSQNIQMLLSNITQIQALSSSTDLCIMSVCQDCVILKPFGPVNAQYDLMIPFEENGDLPCDLTKGLDKAILELKKRSKEYSLRVLNHYMPTLIVLGSGHEKGSPDFDRVNSIIHGMGRSGQLFTLPIVIGDAEPGMLKEISLDGQCYRGRVSDLSDVFGLILQSMRSISTSSYANAYANLIDQAKEWPDYECKDEK